MNTEEIKQRIEVMQAFLEGKKIQWLESNGGVWKDIDNPAFSGYFQYRIKPEPSSYWFNVYQDRLGLTHKTRCGADRVAAASNRIAVLKLTIDGDDVKVEVIND